MADFNEEDVVRKRSDTVGHNGVPNPGPIAVLPSFDFVDEVGSPVRSRSGTTTSTGGVHYDYAATASSAALEDEEHRENRLIDLKRRAMSIMVSDGNYEGAPVDYTLDNLFSNNVKWAQKVSAKHPEFFSKLAAAQHPDYLW